MSKTPFNVMRHNDWDRAPREPVSMIALGNAIFGAAAISTSSLALLYATGVAATFAISAVTSWALSALAPKPPSGVGTQGLLTNARNAAAPHEYVYGEVRKGGVVTYIESTGEENRTLHQIIVLAGHEVAEIGDIYINDEVVTFDAGNVVNSGPFSGTIFIEKFLGNQVAPPASLLELSNQIDSTFVGNGIAYLYVRMEYNQDVFVNGIPLFTAKVKGKKVFDPRTSTTAYSANAALCVRDYLVTDYGMADVGSTDDTIFSVAANVCDENVSKVGGGTEKRYEMNGVISSALAPSDILQSMMTSCAGTLFWGQGKWQLRAGYYTAPVKTFTLDDLRGPISLSTRTSRRDNFNIVRGKFNDAEQRYITSDYPEIYGTTFVTEDNNLENALDLELPFTTSSAMAQRLAKLTLFRGREQMAFNADFSMEAFNVQVGDIIALTNSRYGWTEKEFEVLGWRLAADGDAGDLRVNLSLRETSEAAFDWNAEERAIIANNTTLPDPFSAGPPSDLVLTNVGFINDASDGDGTFIPSVLASWTASSDAFIFNYEVEWKKSADTEYNQITTTGTQAEIAPLEAGQTYQVRVRARNVLSVASGFISSSILTTGDSTAPSAPTAGTATGGFNTITIDWTNPTDKDFKQALIYRNTSNNSATATLVAAISGDTFIDGALPASSTRYYWVRAEDYSGNISGFSGNLVATTNAQPLDGTDGQNATGFSISNAAHSVPAGRSGVVESYAGSGTDIEVYDGVSRLSWIDSGSPASGQFTFAAIAVSPVGALTVGARSGIPAGVRVADHSNMDVNEDVVTITFTVTARSFSGTSFSFNIVQSITKSSAGADGAGRWNIPVATLPTTSAEAQSAWDAANVAGRDPVESDQAWFYTGTEANPTGQSVWLYDSGTSSWNKQEEVIDGDLLVTGTVTSDKVVTNFIDAFTINANNITTGTLTADRINIDNVTMDTDGSGRLIVKTAGVDSDQIALNAASQLRFDKDTLAAPIPVFPSFDFSSRVTFTHDPNTVQILAVFSARANLSLTAGYGFASVYLVRKENGVVVEEQQLQNIAVGTQNTSRAAPNYVQSYITRQEVYTPPAVGVVTEIEIRFTSLQSNATDPDFFLDESFLQVTEIKR